VRRPLGETDQSNHIGGATERDCPDGYSSGLRSVSTVVTYIRWVSGIPFLISAWRVMAWTYTITHAYALAVVTLLVFFFAVIGLLCSCQCAL
jgi:hypothetical protein